MEVTENTYTKIKNILKESNYYHALSDKTDLYDENRRIVTTYSLANLVVKFAEEFSLNKDLAELIAYARDLGFPPYGQLGREVLKRKYKGFNQAECSIQILKSILENYNKSYKNNISMPEGLEQGILSSFNKGKSKEGLLIWMIENTYELGRMNLKNNTEMLDMDLKNHYIINIDYLWDKYMKNIEITNKAISENILAFSETAIEEED